MKRLPIKMAILVILGVAAAQDRLIGQPILSDLLCCNERISILENAGRMGVPFPERLMDVLGQLEDGKKEAE